MVLGLKKGLLAHQPQVTGTRQRYRNLLDDVTGTGRHDKDLIRHQHRLRNAVGDQQRRNACQGTKIASEAGID